jgi:hypothetical protein
MMPLLAQVVAQQFQLDCIPQSAPRAAEYSINEFMPKLTEQGLNPLTHTAVQLALAGHIPSCDQQQLVFFSQMLGKLRPVVSQVGQHHAAINCFCQLRGWPAIIEIPTGTAFAKVCAFIAQQSHATVTDGFADWNRLGVKQVESATTQPASRFKQPTNERPKAMQALKPLLVGAKLWESRSKVIGNQLVGLFERGDAKKALHQADGDDFGISEGRHGIGRTAPVGQPDVALRKSSTKQ